MKTPPLFPKTRLRLSLMLVVGSLAFGACTEDQVDPQPTTSYGATTAIGNGQARSYITMDASGKPTEIGMRVTEAGFAGLPATPGMSTLALPAGDFKLPFDHLSFDWNPNGHEPEHVYDLPHFDVHFYMVSMAERMKIELDDAKGDVLPAANLLPTGYATAPNVAPGRTIPMMGRHWIDPTSHEYHGMDFTQTFIYGSYNGAVIFEEPMITKAYFEAKKTETFALPQPAAVARTGVYYPTKYTIGYDAATKEYLVKLHDMVLR
ncbi:hypothetical protein FY528_03530 [Hymenobacter lutimineralis]|uniref:TTHB210-like domain-containing protein n=1 Tax=Hymenobacter lutimineralis TaxID=2606448 RepID=A0A5D6VE65_9BACT|nr:MULTISPECIES: DUF5602 domain-containing protein [Hymenobacter]QIX61276.1 DUF5602 domain-containing protein [Hymenobacter sp. BT18]TYZ13492.1 hypothetical protein FY528_03530 [Hymenobacter lutimineralis]